MDSSQGSPPTQGDIENGNQTPIGALHMPLRMLEARLLHHYLTSTSHTLWQDGLSAYHLSMTIPQMATSFPYLLDSILALTALHLATTETENRLSWLDAAVKYHSQACSGLGQILPDIPSQHYEPAFVSSVFIMLFSSGFTGISSHMSHTIDPLAMVLELRTLIAGAAMLFLHFNEMGCNAELSGWLCSPDTEESLEGRVQHWGIIESLERMQSIVDEMKTSEKELYRFNWQLLHQAVQPWPKIGPHGGPIAWPFFVSDDFISRLQNGDWVSRILFLHYSLSMRLLCHRWYVRDWGRRLVIATLDSLEEVPDEWREIISWVKEAAEIHD
ncbi:hypothetical protein N7462_005334 [Penicillium macrosclerotiorum]|uniref:uncharacterized protein n=1 Tax=Penicillium macrosclerotiorum TaxID=303699 RepID=UPI0025494302|nr:uncharacterized protein N7462_005334 [Penicillium macrosclerotiorum]KAJ5682169.1 hypothetical protein N7462_005334 [Penicillium macrosclerotiorum]